MSQPDERQKSKSSGSANTYQKSRDGQFKASGSCTRGKTKVRLSQPMSKMEETDDRSRVSRDDAAVIGARSPMQLMQLRELIDRSITEESLRSERKASSSPYAKKTGCRVDRFDSPERFFDGYEGNEYPRRQLDSRKQLKIPNRDVDSERELSRRRLKLAGRHALNKNCQPS